MGAIEDQHIYGIQIRESANDGSDFTNPDADYRLAFLGEDGLWHVKDSAGAVTDPFSGAGSVATDAIWDAAGDLAVGTGANTAARKALGTEAYGLVSEGGTVAWAEILPWTIQIAPFIPKANTNWSTIFVPATIVSVFGSQMQSSGAQNAEITWDVVLAKGTWTFTLIHSRDSNRGIYTVSLAGSSIGTIDGYNGTPSHNTVSNITSVAVANTAKLELKLAMLTKNASASSYFGIINLIQLRRTA